MNFKAKVRAKNSLDVSIDLAFIFSFNPSQEALTSSLKQFPLT